MGATSTLSSTVVYCVLPGCKGWCTNLAGQHQKKSQQNKPIPTGISDPIGGTHIPGCVNRVQMESVFPDDSVLKGMVGWSCISLLLFPRCCHM